MLSVFTRQFINPGSNAFVVDEAGALLDMGDAANPFGRVSVKSVGTRGIFAYTETAALANMAVLTGEAGSCRSFLSQWSRRATTTGRTRRSRT